MRACASPARRARVQCACRARSARACSCAMRSAASAGVAVARPKALAVPVRRTRLLSTFCPLFVHSFVLARLDRGRQISHGSSMHLSLFVGRGAPRSVVSSRFWLVLGRAQAPGVLDTAVQSFECCVMKQKHLRVSRWQARQDAHGIGNGLRAALDANDEDGGPLATATATISDPWKPSNSHLQLTRALPLTAWREQLHALDDVHVHTTAAGICTSAGGCGSGAARASSHQRLPQQTAEHNTTVHCSCEQHALNRVQRGATGESAAASRTVEDPKRALVHALQNDLSRMSVLLERL